jgi:predicted nucleic acid-binding protein
VIIDTNALSAFAGTPIPMNDTWIAALAREHSLPDLSADARFDLVRDVSRLGW